MHSESSNFLVRRLMQKGIPEITTKKLVEVFDRYAQSVRSSGYEFLELTRFGINIYKKSFTTAGYRFALSGYLKAHDRSILNIDNKKSNIHCFQDCIYAYFYNLESKKTRSEASRYTSFAKKKEEQAKLIGEKWLNFNDILFPTAADCETFITFETNNKNVAFRVYMSSSTKI
jgi:hypothetical protein